MSPRTTRSWVVPLVTGAAAIAVTLVVWQVAVSTSHASQFIVKTPLDVWRYLFLDDAFAGGTPAARRAAVAGQLVVTLGHAAVGLAVGVTLGAAGALLLAASAGLRALFLPIAIFLQTVPLIALAPVIYALFGSGVLTAAIIAGVVTFFPLLVNLMAGLDAAGQDIRDLVAVLGGSRLAALRLVAVPAALPYLFAGLKLAVPATIGAAMLYEFLFSFEGLGAAMVTARQYSQYALMWTIVPLSTLVSLLLYGLVGIAERAVLAGRRAPVGSGA